MNAAGLRSIKPNVRVILINNGGGSEFQFFWGKRQIPTIDNYICAEHDKVAAGWIKSLGYDYYTASSKDELDSIISRISEPSNRPLFLEVITDMEDDAEKTIEYYSSFKEKDSSGGNLMRIVKNVYQSRRMNKIRKIVGILKEK